MMSGKKIKKKIKNAVSNTGRVSSRPTLDCGERHGDTIAQNCSSKAGRSGAVARHSRLLPLALKAVRIQEEDFSLQEEVGVLRATSQRMGGIATFLGCARDFSEGKDIFAIEFEQYAEMAEKAMRALRDEAMLKFNIIDVRMVHRVTTVLAGEQIVLIVVGAEHRKPAFLACEWLIDTLKKRVPIWKKEVTPDGDSWVTPHP